MENVTNDHVEYIAEKFEEISRQAEKLTFSRYRLSFFTPPNKDLKSYKKFLYNLTHPFTTPFQTQSAFFLIVYISSILFINSIGFGISTINEISDNGLNISTIFHTSNWINLLFNIVIGGYCSVISYKWWIDSIFTKKNWRSKFIFLFLFILLLFSVSTQIRPPSHSLHFEEVIFIILLLSIIISAVTIFVAQFIDAIQSILNFLYSIFGGYFEINNPRPLKIIEELVIGEIPHLSTNQTMGQNVDWKLLNIPLKDIQTIHEWSKENREGSEKRVIPTTILIAILGIIFSIQFFIDGATNIYKDFTILFQPLSFSDLNPKTIFPLIVNIFLIFIIAKFLFSLINLIKNIVAQNLVIEACILAEYTLTLQAKNEKNDKNKNWVEKFFNCFSFYRNEK